MWSIRYGTGQKQFYSLDVKAVETVGLILRSWSNRCACSVKKLTLTIVLVRHYMEQSESKCCCSEIDQCFTAKINLEEQVVRKTIIIRHRIL